ncbi:MAG: ROK family protein [Spirochaetales bacterium]|nr:ROK family protein [Spirochaetales bacterium]
MKLESFIASDLKALNRKTVYGVLKSGEPISRAKIARETGISAPTVLKIIDYFLSKGVVEELESGNSGNRVGRKPKLLRFNPDIMHAIGIKYDGYHLQIGLVNLASSVVFSMNRFIETEISVFLEEYLPECVSDLIEQSGIRKSSVSCLGLGLPGVVDPELKRIDYAPFLLGSDNLFELKTHLDVLESKVGFPVVMANDANSAVQGEFAARNLGADDSLLYVELGRGLGAGIMLNGVLHKGAHSRAGELGYTVLGTLHQRTETDPGWIETEMELTAFWAEIAEKGSPSRERQEKIVSLLSLAVTNICIMLDIDLVVVGSGSKYPFLVSLVEDLQEEVNKKAIFEIRCETSVAANSGIIGSAVFAQELWLGDLFAG